MEGGCELQGSSCILLDAERESPVSGKVPFSISVWVKTSAEGEQSIIQQRDRTSWDGEFELLINKDGTVYYYEYSESRFGTKCTSRRAVNDGRWHHIVLVRDSVTRVAKVFIDGELDCSTDLSPVDIQASRRFALGCDLADTDSYFQGVIDEVMVFRRVLEDIEVTAIYRSGSGEVPAGDSGPIAYAHSGRSIREHVTQSDAVVLATLIDHKVARMAHMGPRPRSKETVEHCYGQFVVQRVLHGSHPVPGRLWFLTMWGRPRGQLPELRNDDMYILFLERQEGDPAADDPFLRSVWSPVHEQWGVQKHVPELAAEIRQLSLVLAHESRTLGVPAKP